jgi:hypothetical protein
MNWTDQYDTGGESTDVFQPSATPFSQQRRKRFVVLSLLLGGGFIAIIGMRTISDGPASANAGTDAEVAISRYLAPAPTAEETSGAEDPLAVLASFGAPATSVAVEELRSNPFMIPGRNSGMPIQLAPVRMDQDRNDRMTQMLMTVEAMRVSMVLEGRHSVAIVGGVSLSIDKPVEYEPDLVLQLVAINKRGIMVTAPDPLLEASIEIRLSRP